VENVSICVVDDNVNSHFPQELENARKIIQELEADLKSERSRLRNLDTQQSRTQRDKDGLLNQLKRTESVSACLGLFVPPAIQATTTGYG
jgi:hypothetical protein